MQMENIRESARQEEGAKKAQETADELQTAGANLQELKSSVGAAVEQYRTSEQNAELQPANGIGQLCEAMADVQKALFKTALNDFESRSKIVEDKIKPLLPAAYDYIVEETWRLTNHDDLTMMRWQVEALGRIDSILQHAAVQQEAAESLRGQAKLTWNDVADTMKLLLGYGEPSKNFERQSHRAGLEIASEIGFLKVDFKTLEDFAAKFGANSQSLDPLSYSRP